MATSRPSRDECRRRYNEENAGRVCYGRGMSGAKWAGSAARLWLGLLADEGHGALDGLLKFANVILNHWFDIFHTDPASLLLFDILAEVALDFFLFGVIDLTAPIPRREVVNDFHRGSFEFGFPFRSCL